MREIVVAIRRRKTLFPTRIVPGYRKSPDSLTICASCSSVSSMNKYKHVTTLRHMFPACQFSLLLFYSFFLPEHIEWIDSAITIDDATRWLIVRKFHRVLTYINGRCRCHFVIFLLILQTFYFRVSAPETPSAETLIFDAR